MGKFETRPYRPTADKGARLRRVRIGRGLPIADAALRLELSILRYALLENGEVDLAAPEDWARAVEELSR